MQSEPKTKRKRSQAAGDCPGPKRPAGAYLLFLQDFRRGFLQARPDVTVTAREVASAAGAAWRGIDQQLKGQYEARSAAEKARYAHAKKEQMASSNAEKPAPNPPDNAEGPEAAAVQRDSTAAPAMAGDQADGDVEADPGPGPAEGREHAVEQIKHCAHGKGAEAAEPGKAAPLPGGADPWAAPGAELPCGSTEGPPGLQWAPSQLLAWGPQGCGAAAARATGCAAAEAAAGSPGEFAAPLAAQQAAQQAEGASAQPACPSGFSLFIQEARAAYEAAFWCGPAPLPEVVLAAAQLWWSLPGWQRLQFAIRQAQVQAANLALGMHTLIPDLEYKLANIAAAATSWPHPRPATSAGCRAGPQPISLLEQLLASDAGLPPVPSSMAVAPPVLRRVAEAAAQMAWANQMRDAPPEGRALMAATAQAVVGAAAHAAVGMREAGVALTIGGSPAAQPGWTSPVPPCAGPQWGGPSPAIQPSSICRPLGSAMDSVLGLLHPA